MIIDIQELKKVKIEPGDVILLKTSMPVSMEQRERLIAAMSKFFPNNKCMILGGLTMEIYRQQCEAQQFSDQMTCVRCALNWDVNDPHPSACQKK